MHMYSDLAPWFHLVTHPSDYAEEAAFVIQVVEGTIQGEARTLLELGSGGGNNASHLKTRFECTLTDLSPKMLELSKTLNPECEHLVGDMRTLRLGRVFDVVFGHDALSYLTTEDDLGAALVTAAEHVRPGGVVVLTPDATTEIFTPGTDTGGHDGDDGRSLRYLEWTHAPDPPDAQSYIVDYAIVVREPGRQTRVVHDRHVLGLFPEATWRRLLVEAGLEPLELPVENPYAAEQAAFVARRPG
jgi:SAM-dependent methyltransferase